MVPSSSAKKCLCQLLNTDWLIYTTELNRNSELLNRIPMSLARSWFQELMMTQCQVEDRKKNERKICTVESQCDVEATSSKTFFLKAFCCRGNFVSHISHLQNTAVYLHLEFTIHLFCICNRRLREIKD